MPRKRILARRQPAQEDDHYSDPLFREDGESPETPTLFHGRTQQSTAKTSRTKNKNFLARLILNKRSRKRKDDLEQLVAGTEYNKTDYRERWPTVTTLVAPSIPNFLEDIDEELEEDGKARRRSTKAKALGAVAMPLDWLADRLGSVSEHLGRQIEVADSRAQEKAVATSTRGSTAKPGKSTHPYDTGVVPSVEAPPKENPTAPAETQVTDTGKIKGDGLSRGKGDPRSPTKQRHRRPSDRSATSERSHHKVLLEHGRAIVTPTNQRSTAQGRQYLQLSSEAIEEPMLLEERNKWLKHFLESAKKTENQSGTTNPKSRPEQGRSHSSSSDGNDVRVQKARDQWKSGKGRHASEHPRGPDEQEKCLSQNRDFVPQSQKFDRQPSTTQTKYEPSRYRASRRASSTGEAPQGVHSGANKHLLRPPHPPSTSNSPASARPRPRSRLSSEHQEIRTTVTTPNSAQQGSSEVHDFAPLDAHFPHRHQTPKAGFLGHWLGMLSNKAPPSRAISPSEDLEELTLIVPTEEVIAARRRCPSNITTASRESKRSHKTEHTPSSDARISFEGDPHRPLLGQRSSWFSMRRKSSPLLGKSQRKTLTPAKNDTNASRRTSRDKTSKGKSSDISRAGSRAG